MVAAVSGTSGWEFQSTRPKLHVERRHCPHCQQHVSLKTYKAHRRLYHNADSGVWESIDSSSFLVAQAGEESPPRCDHGEKHYSDEDPFSPPHDFGMDGELFILIFFLIDKAVMNFLTEAKSPFQEVSWCICCT